MSGLEVVGVVFGALPLLVSAVKAYRHHVQGWENAARELKSLNRQLTTEQAKLYNVCELFISDVVPLQDIEPMLADPFGPMWKSEHTDKMVQKKLGQSYRPFMGVVQEVSEALENIAKRLQVQISPDGQVKWLERGNMTRQFKKFLFRLDRDKFRGELATISKSVGDMETLARQGVSLEPGRRKRSRRRLYNILRDLATSIHRALFSNICCSDHHDVGLELAARLIEVGYDGDDEDVRCSAKFNMTISFEMAVQAATTTPADEASESNGPSLETKRFWDELSIQAPAQTLQPSKTTKPWQPPKPQAKTSKSFVFGTSQTSSFTGFRLSPRPRMPDIKSAIALVARPVTNIAFIETAATTTVTTEASTGTTGTMNMTSTTIAGQQILTTASSPGQPGPFSLCMTLKKAYGAAKRPMCYGHLVDHTCSVKRHFQVCPLGTSSHSSDDWSIVTLEDVLQHKKGLQPLISLAEKVQLALAIASSLLQLSKTPWLPEGLTNKNVYFFRRGDAPPSYNRAFLLNSLPRSDNDNNNDIDGISTSLSISSHSINPTLFSLGILLLEIILGESFEKSRAVYKKQVVDDGTNEILDTAHALLEKRVMRINPQYATLVKWCINCTETNGFDNDGFRQEVYNNVVMDLECLADSTKLGM